MIYYVNAAAKNGDGSKEHPFTRIQQAADAAMPGDEVLVYPGVYRENVNPRHAGTPDARITYRSVEPLGAVIKGSEIANDWEKVVGATEGNVYVTRVPNAIFTERNPFTTRVSGDWYMAHMVAHLGDVYLNGKSMYEVTNRALVDAPVRSAASWDPDFSVYVWYTEQDEERDETVIYANFQGLDPNEELVEITARKACFYPEEEGIGYITLSGFAVTQAATQWAPPTAYQEGMVGPHWSRGWIIEDCDISESKCSGISLGKYLQPENDNKWLRWKYKDGTQTERDVILQAQREGWTKENIGHHIVRRCNIHDCGQTGIVGHLGGVFSLIENNHIHHINNKQNLAGAEIGGIKMHAAIDCVFRHNHIHHCTRGIWLDWQAQGTRVTGNLFHDNTLPNLSADAIGMLKGLQSGAADGSEGATGTEEGNDAAAAQAAIIAMFQGMGEDVFIEVSHGPTLLDNNIFLSARAVKIACQGVALVHNLIGGSLVAVGIGTDNGSPDLPSPRYTPYHVPHRTEVAGFMTFLHGDDRFYNNIFLQQDVNPILRMMEQRMAGDGNQWDDGCVSVGTMRFDDGYETFEEWQKDFEGYCGMGSPDSNRYYKHLPVWTRGNVFYNGAKPWQKEKDYVEDTEHRISLQLVKVGRDTKDQPAGALTLKVLDGEYRLNTNLFDYIPEGLDCVVNTETLGMAFEPEEKFENPDRTPILFDTDILGQKRDWHPIPGPFAAKPDGNIHPQE